MKLASILEDGSEENARNTDQLVTESSNSFIVYLQEHVAQKLGQA